MKNIVISLLLLSLSISVWGQDTRLIHNTVISFTLRDERPERECRSVLKECKSGQNGSISIKWGKCYDGAPVALGMSYNGDDTFVLEEEFRGVYRICHKKSGLYLTINGADEAGSELVISTYKDEDNGQRFRMRREFDQRNGPLLIKWPGDLRAWRVVTLKGNYLGMQKPSRNWQTPIVLTNSSWGHSPYWYLYHHSGYGVFHKQYINSGNTPTNHATKFDGQGIFQFLSAGNEGLAVAWDGTALKLVKADKNDKSQQFRITKKSDRRWGHCFNIAPVNAQSDDCLTYQRSAGSYGESFVARPWTSCVSFIFHIENRPPSVYYYIVTESGGCLDVEGRQCVENRAVGAWGSAKDAAWQQWKLVAI